LRLILVGRFYVDDIPFNLHFIRGHRGGSGETESSTAANIETGAMAGTFDFVLLQFAVFERAVIVGAEIGDGIIVIINVKDHKSFFLEFDEEARSGRNVGFMSYLNEVCHGGNGSVPRAKDI